VRSISPHYFWGLRARQENRGAVASDGFRDFDMVSIETIHWHTLAPGFLNSTSRVIDLGANYGLFARAITERTGCQCIALEPSPEPFHGIKPSRLIQSIQAAVAGKSGTMGFRVDPANPLAGALTEDKSDVQVRVMTLPELIQELDWSAVDLLKVDIEGAEIEMLAACPDQLLSERIRQISIEFHDFCGITPAAAVRRCLGRLHSLGFASIRMSRIGHQDTWLINRHLLPITRYNILYHRLVTRNWYGAKRVASRLF
jgi:FkbM family methyltransferase